MGASSGVLIFIAVIAAILGLCYLGGTVLVRGFDLLTTVLDRVFRVIYGR
ncbi:hypothetical protein GCM10010528_30390 [Gordonia defluvii]|jgi:hypothetical protein|uniref:Uncharacterized protein n=1 Tax=Gordonia defluvii TaxID=283718 RepID=A0ABP6LMI7_9ACTN|nr:hypothetical protein [Gordonia sp. UBA5067]